MVFERGVGVADDGAFIRPWLENQHGVDALFTLDFQCDHRRILDAGLRHERALDVLREHVQSLRRDDHFLLAALDQQTALGIDLADVAGMKEAVLIERRTVFSSCRSRSSRRSRVVARS